MFLPSGRVHALGAGAVIFEIQQNSDTTYRVFDWNRVGLDGKPRPLHLEESLACIDFEDFEPRLLPTEWMMGQKSDQRLLVHDPLFRVEAVRVKKGVDLEIESSQVTILALLRGTLRVEANEWPIDLKPGQFCSLPAGAGPASLDALQDAEFLKINPG
jgi:mannose-6-phosphate isomerase